MLLNNISCRKYGLEDDTVDFIGHALALHLDDSYLDQPALDFVKRMKVHLKFFEYLMVIEKMVFKFSAVFFW